MAIISSAAGRSSQAPWEKTRAGTARARPRLLQTPTKQDFSAARKMGTSCRGARSGSNAGSSPGKKAVEPGPEPGARWRRSSGRGASREEVRDAQGKKLEQRAAVREMEAGEDDLEL
jgi:hypothetical protein